ncbi:hypothetical protein [Micromonospora chersina]|uniref:hypothetical protein n=1 Tax=Micromonospora chersina TaxID=47854 RepID=UPI00371829C1
MSPGPAAPGGLPADRADGEAAERADRPRRTPAPRARLLYKLPFQQGLLKLAIGPLVAVVGIMLVIGGLVETTVNSTAALLGVAIVFGAGRQAVTAFADRRASELLTPVTKS